MSEDSVLDDVYYVKFKVMDTKSIKCWIDNVISMSASAASLIKENMQWETCELVLSKDRTYSNPVYISLRPRDPRVCMAVIA